MKNLISVVVGVALGFAAAYMFIPKVAECPKPTPVTPTAAADSQDVLARTHLAKLTELNPTATKDPARVIRQIAHHFESLSEIGQPAIEPIGQMLATGKDLDYILNDKMAAASGLPFWSWRVGQPVFSGLVLPPSFRLGLVDVLKTIGTEQAENVLLVAMASSTRALEVAYIAQVLEKMVPGKYTEIGLAAARRLLAEPSRPISPSALDANADSGLYAMLAAHGDKSALETAQSKLTGGGRLDFDAAKYIVATLKEQAMPELAKVYQSANAEDKNRIANLAFAYVGASADANQIFKDWILNSTPDANSQTLNARPRSLYLQMLCGGNFGPFQAEVPTNREVINSRIGLLNELNAATTDARLKQTIGQSLQCLQAR